MPCVKTYRNFKDIICSCQIDPLPKLAIYRLASPITHVTADDPPLLLVHGELDRTVPFSQSKTMHQAYQQVGLEATLIKVAGAGHSFKQVTDKPISPSHKEIEQMVRDFFIKHLLPTR
ncbi:hypothetical protein ES702_03794 [subsurface metagenome]